MNDDLISVIVPVYNVSEYLKQCIDSIIGQTYKNLEIILIDDGSTDNSLEIIKQYAEKDNRIKYYTRENKGLLYTRIDGVSKATGVYSIFVDSDDWLENNAIEILYNKITEYSADLVKGSYRIVNVKNKKDIVNRINDIVYEGKSFNKIYDELVSNYTFHIVWGQLIKTEIIKKYIADCDTSIAMGEDLEINTHMLDKLKKIVVIPNIIYDYRVNENSISRGISFKKIQKKIEDITKSYGNMIKFIKKNSPKNYKKALEKTLKDINHNLLDLAYVKNTKRKEINDYLESVFKNKLIEEIINNVKYKEFDDRFIKKFLLIKNIYNKNYKLYLFNIKLISIIRKHAKE